jgi:hypothetical protein
MGKFVRTLVAVGVVGSAVVGAGTPAFAGGICTSQFRVVASPNAPSGATDLYGADAATPTNAWAVGIGGGAGFSIHWDGSAWKAAPVPAVGNGTTLGDVAMVSPHDVWAVGEFRNAHGRGRSLALHRTNAGWHHVPTPNLGTGENDLYRIIAVGPSDVWAAGLGTVGGVARAIVVRWNGTTWNRIAFPAVGTGDNYLEGIAASRSTGVWVAVEYVDGGTDRAAVFHRTGSTWHRVPFAQPSAGNVQPRDLIAAGSSVWMTGFYRKAGKTVGLLARWNGGHWELFDGVNPTSSTYLEGLATVWPHVVYAFGGVDDGTDTSAFVEVFDGNGWARVKSPTPPGAQAQLNAGAAVHSGSAFLVLGVGHAIHGTNPDQSLVEQACPVFRGPSPLTA